MSYDITWEGRGVVKRFFGHVTSDELFQAGVNLQGDARFDLLLYVINDFLGITGFSFSEGDVDVLNAIDNAASRTNKKLRLAVISTDAQLIALAKQYAISPMNIYPFRIFSTIEEARVWLR